MGDEHHEKIEPSAAIRGRPQAPAEVLRMLILKHVRNRSYETARQRGLSRVKGALISTPLSTRCSRNRYCGGKAESSPKPGGSEGILSQVGQYREGERAQNRDP